jgi:hypothetical protein
MTGMRDASPSSTSNTKKRARRRAGERSPEGQALAGKRGAASPGQTLVCGPALAVHMARCCATECLIHDGTRRGPCANGPRSPSLSESRRKEISPPASDNRLRCGPRRLHCLAAPIDNHRCRTEGGWRCCIELIRERSGAKIDLAISAPLRLALEPVPTRSHFACVRARLLSSL